MNVLIGDFNSECRATSEPARPTQNLFGAYDL